MCKKKQICWRIPELWYPQGPKWPLLMLFPGSCVFFLFSTFAQFGSYVDCVKVIFHILENWFKNMCHTTQTRNFQFELFDLMALVCLDLKSAHRKLRMVFRRVPDTIHDGWMTSFHFDMAVVCNKSQTWQTVKHVYSGPTCDLISDTEANNIGFLSIRFFLSISICPCAYLSNVVWIL